MKIEFHIEEGLDFSLQREKTIKAWIEKVMKGEKKSFKKISYFFCSDNYLLNINKLFLNHNYFTDIITFDYSEEKKAEGEVLISIERVKENAEDYKEPFQRELERTIIHGILHLCGYKDKTPKGKKIMRLKEDECLDALVVSRKS